MTKQATIAKDAQIPFHNQVDYCVGTGRMGLALQKEYQEQLALVQKEIGFSYIRGHGLFNEDMAIYQEYKDPSGNLIPEYNFTYLDLVMDSYLELNIRPFLELGFMPKKMASGEQAIFYWRGNVTPPKSYDAWAKLVQATLKHLMERYGADEVTTWPIEVWNEPNLPGFWKGADMQEYFKLFDVTFHAIKEVDTRFRVGGPAICGVMDELWIRSFMEYCQSNKIPVDFVTRHHYTTELPKHVGHYGYPKINNPEVGFANLLTTREIIDSFPEYKGLEIHITEFSTSYIPNCPLHDTNQNAAYIAHQLSRLGDVNESYSYWTFGDIFEEIGVPFTPFHGGFGMVANGCIPKPTFWTFAFYKKLKGTCVFKSEDAVIVRKDDNTYCGIAWNNADDLDLSFELPIPDSASAPSASARGEYVLIQKIVEEDTCNPRKLWHDMGEPSDLSKEQKALLQDCARPLVTSQRLTATNEKIHIELKVGKYGVHYFELKPICKGGDNGYDYDYDYLTDYQA
ncbi:MAG: xylan 1,4-beta-xylosidase [Lachnospiraceae bacterium]|nr:xylan 1,4-beta-xylosidase [Lachnospiraceae bacterium]